MSTQPLSDLDVYRRLREAAEALDRMAEEAASLVGETASKTAAASVRGMANAVYQHALADDAGGPH
ncbi:hypothetical protein [Phenylobacterium sp.]|uniref:hypothetical protein n=1 Tax=Phenylobacterium sp. TaxID=1871053 RepID=UPI003983A734